MITFWVLDILCLGLVLTCAVFVVWLPNISAAVMALSAMGTVLAFLFVALAAPDVAHSEAVVGTIALPVLYLIAIGKLRTDVDDDGSLGEIPFNRPDPPEKQPDAVADLESEATDHG